MLALPAKHLKRLSLAIENLCVIAIFELHFGLDPLGVKVSDHQLIFPKEEVQLFTSVRGVSINSDELGNKLFQIVLEVWVVLSDVQNLALKLLNIFDLFSSPGIHI